MGPYFKHSFPGHRSRACIRKGDRTVRELRPPIPAIPAFGKQRQKDFKHETNPGYRAEALYQRVKTQCWEEQM